MKTHTPKKIIISVTSDLVTDQRVHKVSQTLYEAGFKVVLFGRKKKNSAELLPRAYQVERKKLFFETGFLFYANYQISLLFYLLRNRADILVANDLDTLLPNFIINRLKKTKLIYDTHEYFTGVPELQNREFVRGCWKKLEEWIIPQLKTIYTVNSSIASLYETEFGVKVHEIRNLPYKTTTSKYTVHEVENKYTIYKKLSTLQTNIILYQGAVNKDRGLEEMIAAMHLIENATFVIIGNGDIFKDLANKIERLNLAQKVILVGAVEMEYLPFFTQLGTIGVSLEKDTNINYKYASPNKVVDYIQSHLPVVATRLIEIEKIVAHYKVGTFVEDLAPQTISKTINYLLTSEAILANYRKNCQKASVDLTWENEQEKLLKLYN